MICFADRVEISSWKTEITLINALAQRILYQCWISEENDGSLVKDRKLECSTNYLVQLEDFANSGHRESSESDSCLGSLISGWATVLSVGNFLKCCPLLPLKEQILTLSPSYQWYRTDRVLAGFTLLELMPVCGRWLLSSRQQQHLNFAFSFLLPIKRPLPFSGRVSSNPTF